MCALGALKYTPKTFGRSTTIGTHPYKMARFRKIYYFDIYNTPQNFPVGIFSMWPQIHPQKFWVLLYARNKYTNTPGIHPHIEVVNIWTIDFVNSYTTQHFSASIGSRCAQIYSKNFGRSTTLETHPYKGVEIWKIDSFNTYNNPQNFSVDIYFRWPHYLPQEILDALIPPEPPL